MVDDWFVRAALFSLRSRWVPVVKVGTEFLSMFFVICCPRSHPFSFAELRRRTWVAPSCDTLSVRYSARGYWGFKGEGVSGDAEGSRIEEWNASRVLRRGLFWGWRRVDVELSFCSRPRRFAHAGGCNSSSDKHAQVTRSSAVWSLIGSDCTCDTGGDKGEFLSQCRREMKMMLSILTHSLTWATI